MNPGVLLALISNLYQQLLELQQELERLKAEQNGDRQPEQQAKSFARSEG